MKENSLIIPVFLHLLFEIAVKSELKEIYPKGPVVIHSLRKDRLLQIRYIVNMH